MSDFQRKEFTADTGEQVSVTLFDDDTVAVRVGGSIEWAGSVERAGTVVGALIESEVFADTDD